MFHARNLSKVHYRLGNLDLLEGHLDEARARFDEALRIRVALVEISKDNDRRQMELMPARARVGLVSEAMTIADRLAAGPKVDPELRIDLALCHAIVSHSLNPADPEASSTYQVRAMESLRAAVKDGYRDRAYLEGEPDLSPLQRRDDFQLLLRDLSIAPPSNPRAPNAR